MEVSERLEPVLRGVRSNRLVFWICLLIVILTWSGAPGLLAQSVRFKRGDVNTDGSTDLSDPVFLLNYLFAGSTEPSCLDAGDIDDDGALSISDPIRLLNFQFSGGPAPESPFEECGKDPTDEDGLECATFEPCAETGVTLEGFTFVGENAQGYPEYTHDQTSIAFVLLPGGTFSMGSPDDGSECFRSGDEGPVHAVRLRPFLIAKYEVTQGQWNDVMGNYPSRFDGVNDWDGQVVNPPDDRDRLPVEQVSWVEIQAFEAKTNLTLPTEAQWEYACRAGTETAFWFGSLLASGEANFDPNRTDVDDECREEDPGVPRSRRTRAVGSFSPNGFGLHDMHGNVWEWCEDVWDPTFYSKPEAAGPDPLSTSGSELRVIRGGGWHAWAGRCRSALRFRPSPSFRNVDLGFRLAGPSS